MFSASARPLGVLRSNPTRVVLFLQKESCCPYVIHQTTFYLEFAFISPHTILHGCIYTPNLTTIISPNQVQAVTGVGGGEFSSPVTVSLREPSDDSSSGPPTAAIIATVVVIIIIILCLIVAALMVYFCW